MADNCLKHICHSSSHCFLCFTIRNFLTSRMNSDNSVICIGPNMHSSVKDSSNLKCWWIQMTRHNESTCWLYPSRWIGAFLLRNTLLSALLNLCGGVSCRVLTLELMLTLISSWFHRIFCGNWFLLLDFDLVVWGYLDQAFKSLSDNSVTSIQQWHLSFQDASKFILFF